MKKVFLKRTASLAAALVLVACAVGISACDNENSDKKDDTVYTPNTGSSGTGSGSSGSSGSGGSTHTGSGRAAANVEIMLPGRDVRDALKELGAGNDSVMKSFKPSATPPAAGVTTKKLSVWASPVDVLAWLDGTTIWYYAAGYTDSGRKIPLRGGVSLFSDDAAGMFSGCKGLNFIDVSGFDASTAESLAGMFSDCSGLTSLDVSCWDTSNIKLMSAMFQGCSGLTSLDLSGLNTSSVTNMSGMFSRCTGLTSLDLSGFDTSHVTDMFQMFEGCTGLTSLDLSGFDTSHVTDMICMFGECESLVTLDLSSFDTSRVERFSNFSWTASSSMFCNCSHLVTIFASSRFVTTAVIDDAMYGGVFDGNSNLVGEKGTQYGALITGTASYHGGHMSYARIDGGPSAPGYFTAKP